MAKTNIAEMVKTLAEPIVEAAGCELVDVEFVKEGGSWFLRVYIDKTGGVTLDDCERISGPLNEAIDAQDPIPHAYYFEVSSPGLERALKSERDFQKAIGKAVEIKLFQAVDGLKRYEGTLTDYDGKSLTVTLENGSAKQFQASQAAKVKTIFKI